MSAIERLSVTHLRSIDHALIEPSLELNLITGQNGQGKTTLLEGISLITSGRLWRSSRETLAIQTDQESASVWGELTEIGSRIEVQLQHGARKRVLLNENKLPRASDILGRAPMVSFSAKDLEIVRGDPSERRAFLDAELSQLFPAYLKSFAAYKRALEQRNALLKRAREQWQPAEAFEVWEEKLADQGIRIREARSQWVAELAPIAAERHHALSQGEELRVELAPNDEGLSAIAYADARQHDIQRGSTTLGPHRDDLSLLVNGLDARNLASQGQQRTAVIALKLAVLETAKKTFGRPPILLLDDVFSDLDSRRRAMLVQCSLEEGGQVFLTCTEPEQAGPELVEQARVFLVSGGVVERL